MVTASAAPAPRSPRPIVTAPAPAVSSVCRRFSPFCVLMSSSLVQMSVALACRLDFLAEFAQQDLLPFQEFGAERIARARKWNLYFRLYGAGMRRHHEDAVGEMARLGDVCVCRSNR